MKPPGAIVPLPSVARADARLRWRKRRKIENLNTDHDSSTFAACVLQGHFALLPIICIGRFQAPPPRPHLLRPAAVGLVSSLSALLIRPPR